MKNYENHNFGKENLNFNSLENIKQIYRYPDLILLIIIHQNIFDLIIR